MKRALISVYDKTGVVDFAKALTELGFEIISTGGTYKLLQEAGLTPLLTAEEVTGSPEMLDGRVKTLHPRLHGGILARRDEPGHMEQLAGQGIVPIDIVVNNLYPFKETVQTAGVTLATAVENIDIGGPSMLRAAAKNFESVAVAVDPGDYSDIINELRGNGSVSGETRLRLSAKAFAHTAHYDALIADYLRKQASMPVFGDTLTLTYEKETDMRYGENPHQTAGFYRETNPPAYSLTSAVKLHGKELSYNNINDASGAIVLLREFDGPAVVACKHANPCGVGLGNTVYEAMTKAHDADPVSIYGGVIAINREMDGQTAEFLKPVLLDIIIAPSYAPEALDILMKRKNTRVLALPGIMEPSVTDAVNFTRVPGGIIAQTYDNVLYPEGQTVQDLRVATKRTPNAAEYADLELAWKIVKHVKSNAIVIAKNGQSVGIGCGQVNRIWAVTQALEHGVSALGTDALKGAAMASDAFFPFDDCVTAAAKAGITAVIHPGGSLNDKDSAVACDRLGIAMVYTGMRHFRH